MDDEGLVKISDFGISKKLEEEKYNNARTSIQGSPFWMAPEVARQKPYTFKTDIWSLGCLVVEMFTGSHPFPHFMSLQALYNMAKETPILPAIPQGISSSAQDFWPKHLKLTIINDPQLLRCLSIHLLQEYKQ